MMALNLELRSPGGNRKRRAGAAQTAEPELQSQPLAKRQKLPYPSQNKSPAEFWDKLSQVPLCRRALREFNRRAFQPIPPKPRLTCDIEDSQVKQLKRFARRGGPDLRSIRGYPEQRVQDKMAPKRAQSGQSSGSSALKSDTKPSEYSSKDAAFEQYLIDNGVYPPGYDYIEPQNLDELLDRLGRRRASLSPSKFSREEFLHFKRTNNEAMTEAQVMSQVFPLITGRSNIPSGYNQVFNNLEPLADHISNAQPDYYNGSRPAEIRAKVRDDLEGYIIASSQRHRHGLPNFFTEVKGPDEKPSKAKRQITQDLALGARAMLKMQSYGLDKHVYDGNAYAFGSTYQSGTGALELYAMHPTESGRADGNPEYHITPIDGYLLTGNLNAYCQGIGAFRNLRDLAKERRDEFIACANERADSNGDAAEVPAADADMTSFISTSQSTRSELFTTDSDHGKSETTPVDELATSAEPTKCTKVHQLHRKNQKLKLNLSLIDEDDE